MIPNPGPGAPFSLQAQVGSSQTDTKTDGRSEGELSGCQVLLSVCPSACLSRAPPPPAPCLTSKQGSRPKEADSPSRSERVHLKPPQKATLHPPTGCSLVCRPERLPAFPVCPPSAPPPSLNWCLISLIVGSYVTPDTFIIATGTWNRQVQNARQPSVLALAAVAMETADRVGYRSPCPVPLCSTPPPPP